MEENIILTEFNVSEVTRILTDVYYNDTSDMEERKEVKEVEIIQTQDKYYLKLKLDKDIIIKLGT